MIYYVIYSYFIKKPCQYFLFKKRNFDFSNKTKVRYTKKLDMEVKTLQNTKIGID